MLIDKAYLFQKVCYILMSARWTDINASSTTQLAHYSEINDLVVIGSGIVRQYIAG